MARDRNKRRTTAELVEELREFHHDEAAERLTRLANHLTAAGLCEYCGRRPRSTTPDGCERKT